MRVLFAVILFFHLQTVKAGTITTNVSSLVSFGNCYPFHSSTSQRFTVSASALTAPLLVTAPAGFEVSLQYKQAYSSSIIINPIAGNITSTIIYVRFSPSAIGSFSANVVNSSTGSTSQSVSVSGTCINWAIPTSPGNYYSTATGNGATLKTALYNKILGHNAQGYTPGVWNAFYTTDVQPNGKVWDVYSTRFDSLSPYEFTLGTDQDNGTGGSSEGQKYNREHSMPQSWFASATPMVSDLHHVFATDKLVNGQRGDLPYGTVSIPNWTSLIGGKRGDNTAAGYTGTVFEPVDEYKGDIARAQLYMATRYENLIAGWQTNATADNVLAGNAFPAYDAWFINLLLSWHNLDPVSDKEIKRNNAIYALQNNRNPFVDSPQFVQKIWGGAIPNEPTVQASSLTFTNKTNTSMQLNWVSGNGANRIVVMRAATSTPAIPVDTIRYLANAIFGSGSSIGNGNFVVYNGSGSTVTVTGLTTGVNYVATVYEYSGWYQTSNYATTGALTNNSSTLPVDWLSFNASLSGDQKILLQWQTASETNNDFFEIERSTGPPIFTTIGKVKGKGNSHTVSDYRFEDLSFEANKSGVGTIYYRIKQTDDDGAFGYSSIQSVKLSDMQAQQKTFFFSVSPNPFDDKLRISFSNPPGAITYSLTDIGGRLLLKRTTNENSSNEIYLNHLEHLLPGMYWLQIQSSGGDLQNTKLIKY